jgi:hypothetical protein
MAVAFESDGGTVFAAANNNNAISVPLPATRPTGSVLLCVIFNRLITASVTTAPSGYTLLSGFPKTSATASGGRLWVYAKEVVGGEAAPTVACDGTTGTAGDLWGACLYCYSGVDLSGGLDAMLDGTPTVQDASGTTTCTYPALTISNADSMLVRTLVRIRDATDTFTETATWAEREDLGSTARTGAQHHLQDKLATASGSQASVTIAPSNTTAARYLALTLALKAVASTPHTRSPADNFAFVDARAKAVGKLRADAIAFADARAQALGKLRADSIAFADARALARGKALADALALVDQATPVEGGGAAPEFTRVIRVLV